MKSAVVANSVRLYFLVGADNEELRKEVKKLNDEGWSFWEFQLNELFEGHIWLCMIFTKNGEEPHKS